MTLSTLLAQNTPTTLTGVAEGSQPLVLKTLLDETGRSLLYVCASDRELERIQQHLPFFTPDADIIAFPAWDCLPYDRVSPNTQVTAHRVTAMAALAARTANSPPCILLTTANGLLQKLPPRTLMREAIFHLSPGQPLNMTALNRFLAGNGYHRVGTAMEPGEYAIRGSIIDLFPPGSEHGCRVDLLGDEIETIRRFDPLSQRSAESIPGLTLQPIGETLLTEQSIQSFRNGYRTLFGAVTKEDPLYESISAGRPYPGMEHWLPLFYERMETLFDYLPEARLILDHQVELVVRDRHENIHDYYDARINAPVISGAAPYHPLPPENLYLMEKEWQERLSKHPPLTCSPFVGEDLHKDHHFACRSGRNFAPERKGGEDVFAALQGHILRRNEEGKQSLVACNSTGSRDRLLPRLREHAIACEPIDSWHQIRRLPADTTGIAVLPLEHGFETPDSIILSEQDILGDRLLRGIARRKKRPEQFMAEAANFSEGELVVHREHGIGRFDGLTTVEVNGIRHDCLKLIYEGDDRLFLPVENIDLITRYGSEDMEGVKLDKLGGVHWQARTAKLRERIKLAAEELLKIAAERQTHQAPPLVANPGLYEEFCNGFPYVETEDQAAAIDEVMTDLASGIPTDRLICGDVGFGKTEVAMRAAFVATTAEHGKMQVAVVTPTTLLARQHYANFKARFSGMPVTIRQLSRLTTTTENKKTLEGLASGGVDIVIGTHALLGKRVQFKRLGLLVVDEEQHFGVKQKETLKKLKADIHVLTLSATPIPRTLQMAMSGIRELSLIATPPVDRLAVRTFVMPYDPVVLREAILREYHRGGQTFYVTPRVKDIAELKQRITELVPEIKIAIAHGQMLPKELDEIMNDFYEGKYHLLLATTIIESGLDVPAANTLIINRADMFGLAQLYQLRGRVGRGKQRAYAYLTLPHHRTITRNALKRLEVMQTLDTLGAGFTVASHDMDIRGFGNLLGEEQSGHVREVGVELYQQMLEEAVSKAKRGESGSEKGDLSTAWSPQINLGLSVLLPESYVEDLELRLGLYRRSAALHTEEEVEEFAAELIDRFGPLPKEVEHLMAVLKIKLHCIAAGIERLDAGPKGLVVTFRNNQFARPEALLDYITRHAGIVKLRADHRLVITRSPEAQNKSTLQSAHDQAALLASMAA